MSLIRLPAAVLAAVGLALGASALTPAPAAAQSTTQVAQADSFSDAQLESFAVAAIQVRDIRSRYMPQIEQAGSQEEKEQLALAAQQEMISAVKSSPGISVEDYNAIIQAASSDPALADRVNGIIKDTAAE